MKLNVKQREETTSVDCNIKKKENLVPVLESKETFVSKKSDNLFTS